MDGGLARFTATLREWGVEVRGDELYVGDRFAAVCTFEPVAAFDGKLAEWCRAGARPFIGAPSGVFLWNHAPLGAGEDEVGTVVRAICHASRGAVLKIARDVLRELVVQRTFGLRELTHQYGFDEGMALLEATPGPYIEHVLAQIREVLAREQIEICVGLTEHRGPNPLRAWPPMTRAGADVPNERVDRELAGLEMVIWAFRDRVHAWDDEFWYDVFG